MDEILSGWVDEWMGGRVYEWMDDCVDVGMC